MSTATLTRPARTNSTTKLAQANMSDPRCEECGSTVGIVLCKNCREIGAHCHLHQQWACVECGTMRVWGFGSPWNAEMKAALGCSDCGAVTRHEFLGVS